MKLTKNQRKQMSDSQHGNCGLCKKKFSATDQICHDSAKNKLLCRRCMLFVATYRAAIEDGFTLDDLIEYEGASE